MKKKILSAIGVAAMAATCCLSFTACGHKHTYKNVYELATCTDMGFTLHCCTTCDYMYADEFVKPYGHAYEYCVALAAPVSEERIASISNTRANGDNVISINGLPPAELISEVLCEVTDPLKNVVVLCFNEELNEYYTVSAGDYKKAIAFEKSSCAFCGEGGEKAYGLNVPRVKTENEFLPVPYLDIGQATINMVMNVVPENGGSGAFSEDVHSHHGFDGFSEIMSNSPKVASVPTKYERGSGGALTYGTKATAADLDKDEEPTQLTMSHTIEEIEANAFANCGELKRVELPSELKKIGANAFAASKLDFLIMPKSLTSIGSNAFGDCKNMKFLFYFGTQTDWDKIQFESANDAIKSVPRYYYSESKPATDGNFWHFVNDEPTVW